MPLKNIYYLLEVQTALPVNKIATFLDLIRGIMTPGYKKVDKSIFGCVFSMSNPVVLPCVWQSPADTAVVNSLVFGGQTLSPSCLILLHSRFVLLDKGDRPPMSVNHLELCPSAEGFLTDIRTKSQPIQQFLGCRKSILLP